MRALRYWRQGFVNMVVVGYEYVGDVSTGCAESVGYRTTYLNPDAAPFASLGRIFLPHPLPPPEVLVVYEGD